MRDLLIHVQLRIKERCTGDKSRWLVVASALLPTVPHYLAGFFTGSLEHYIAGPGGVLVVRDGLVRSFLTETCTQTTSSHYRADRVIALDVVEAAIKREENSQLLVARAVKAPKTRRQTRSPSRVFRITKEVVAKVKEHIDAGQGFARFDALEHHFGARVINTLVTLEMLATDGTYVWECML